MVAGACSIEAGPTPKKGHVRAEGDGFHSAEIRFELQGSLHSDFVLVETLIGFGRDFQDCVVIADHLESAVVLEFDLEVLQGFDFQLMDLSISSFKVLLGVFLESDNLRSNEDLAITQPNQDRGAFGGGEDSVGLISIDDNKPPLGVGRDDLLDLSQTFDDTLALLLELPQQLHDHLSISLAVEGHSGKMLDLDLGVVSDDAVMNQENRFTVVVVRVGILGYLSPAGCPTGMSDSDLRFDHILGHFLDNSLDAVDCALLTISMLDHHRFRETVVLHGHNASAVVASVLEQLDALTKDLSDVIPLLGDNSNDPTTLWGRFLLYVQSGSDSSQSHQGVSEHSFDQLTFQLYYQAKSVVNLNQRAALFSSSSSTPKSFYINLCSRLFLKDIQDDRILHFKRNCLKQGVFFSSFFPSVNIKVVCANQIAVIVPIAVQIR